MQDAGQTHPNHSVIISTNVDPGEARLEAKEMHNYLLAKSYFDCREFERCASVFLPSGLPKGPPSSSPSAKVRSPLIVKGKGKDLSHEEPAENFGSILSTDRLPVLSQKSLFLALYAKYMSGEKRKDEETEMVLGPQDKGSVINKELVEISRSLEGYFAGRDPDRLSGGWLEYLYGIVLAKGKNEADAKQWFIKSVHMFPYNWGAWTELNELLGSVEEVGVNSSSERHQLINRG